MKKIKERPIFIRFSFMGRKRSSHEEKFLQFFFGVKRDPNEHVCGEILWLDFFSQINSNYPLIKNLIEYEVRFLLP